MQPEEGKRERYMIQEGFRDFVNRTLALQCDSRIEKFSLKCHIHEDREMAYVAPWIRNAVEHGITEMDISIKPHFELGELLANIKTHREVSLSRGFFTSKTLVKLTLGTIFTLEKLPPDVSLPALKSLFIDLIHFQYEDLCYVLLPGYPVLEDLVVRHKDYETLPCRISSQTIKKLSVHYDCEFEIGSISSMAFDIPSLVSLDYSDYALPEYITVNLESLVEARLDLRCTKNVWNPDVWGLFYGIRNVETLHLTPNSVDVISQCLRDGIPLPVFNNLVNLSCGSKNKRSWKLLPYLLEQCPKLQTLIIQVISTFLCTRVKFNNMVSLSSGSKNIQGWKLLPLQLNQSPKLETLIIKEMDGYTTDVDIPLNQVKVLHILCYRGTAQELKRLKSFLRGRNYVELVRVEIAQGVVMDDGKILQTLGVSVSSKCKTEVEIF